MPEKLKLDAMFESVYDGCIVYLDYLMKEDRVITPPAGMWNVTLSDESKALMSMMEADLKALPWELFSLQLRWSFSRWSSSLQELSPQERRQRLPQARERSFLLSALLLFL